MTKKLSLMTQRLLEECLQAYPAYCIPEDAGIRSVGKIESKLVQHSEN